MEKENMKTTAVYITKEQFLKKSGEVSKQFLKKLLKYGISPMTAISTGLALAAFIPELCEKIYGNGDDE